MKISQEHLASWPSKEAVAERLGCSTKTVERYADRGRLRKQNRNIAGRKPIPVFNPEDVEALEKEQEEAARIRDAELLPATGSETRSAGLALAVDRGGRMLPSEAFQQLATMGENMVTTAEALGNVVEELTTAVRLQAEMRKHPTVPTEAKMVLTLREAEALGFVRRYLRELVRAGKLHNFGTEARPRVARAQLESLWRGDDANT